MPYDFTATYSRPPRQLWTDYEEAISTARSIVNGTYETLPAYSAGICKNCVWYAACLKTLEASDDLTLIPELGRSKRDASLDRIGTIRDLADCDLDLFMAPKGKTVFRGIGPDTLVKLQARARLLKTPNASPYLSGTVSLPVLERELFFDIEVDPMRDVCYLHGFVERRGGDNEGERFIAFFAEDPTPAAEAEAFAEAWRYMQNAQPCAIFS